MKLKKALVFAAGYGERLRPLTLTNPKPMLPIGDKPIIEYALFYLKKFGVEEIVINLFYLAHKIEEHISDGSKFGLKVHYSKETKLMGTGGGLKLTEEHFKNEEVFLTLNSDTLINCDLYQMLMHHKAQSAKATLALAAWQKGYTRVEEKEKHFVKTGSGDHLFTGLALWSPKVFDHLEAKPSNLITEGAVPLQKEGHTIGAFIHDGYWRDIGTLESYEEAQAEWAAGHHKRI